MSAHRPRSTPAALSAALLLAAACALPAGAAADVGSRAGGGGESAAHGKAVDRSGRPRVGKASYYAHSFAGRTMADGTRMDSRGDNAASKTLPLGTRVRVTNLENGRSATVTIRDRGPYVPGRIVDLSPRTAREVGIGPAQGVARVEVAPIELPPRDGEGGR
jgi:rare lipoprotein A